MTALKKISKTENLEYAWSDLYRKTKPSHRAIAGTDCISVSDFTASTIETQLRYIRREIQNGKYSFSPLRPVLIKKKNGEDRLICVPTVRDRIVQKALLQHLSKNNRYRLNNGVSYCVKGQGVSKAAKQAKQLRKYSSYVYKTDISAFFDSIPRKNLEAVIIHRIKERSLHPLLLKAMNCEIEECSGYRLKRINKIGIRKGQGIRQGMPLSSLFANLILIDFDNTMIASQFQMIRYADDMIFLAQSKEKCFEIHKLCKMELAKVGLTIPDIGEGSKTQIFGPNQVAEFLGVELVAYPDDCRLEISETQFLHIREEILRYSSSQDLADRGHTITSFGRGLEGAIAGYKNAYNFCDNIGLLEHRLAEWKRLAVKNLFKDLGINISSLTTQQLVFLGIEPNTQSPAMSREFISPNSQAVSLMAIPDTR